MKYSYIKTKIKTKKTINNKQNKSFLILKKSTKSSIGMKPLFVFNGELFEQREEYKKLKNMLIDFFRDEVAESVNLKGLEYIISVTAEPVSNPTDFGKVFFRVYTIQMKKSGTKQPRIELEEMGPSFDFVFRRNRFAGEDVMKEATKIPKELQVKIIIQYYTYIFFKIKEIIVYCIIITQLTF